MEDAMLTVLRGTLDSENPLSLLRGNGLVWRTIFDIINKWYQAHIDRETVAFDIVSVAHAKHKGLVSFPEPQGLQINMMPIRLFMLHESVPENCKQYIPLIRQCIDFSTRWDRELVAYLTIHESMVPVGQTQRRSGLHVERPGQMSNNGYILRLNYPEYFWGRGFKMAGENLRIGGIYMASNVSISCTVWPVLVNNSYEVSNAHGGIEHMRNCVGPGRQLAAGELCWLTDQTPHESTPVKAPCNDPSAKVVARSFFRLVVGEISLWYAKHSTPNPLGILPDSKIVYEDKFSSDGGMTS